MKRNTLFLNLVLAWIFVGLGSALAEKPVNDSERVTLNGNVHPAVTAASVGSAVDDSTPMEHMVLLLKGSAAQEAALTQLIAGQNDPKSPLFHQFLTPQQFGAQFGVADGDMAAVTNWLESHGFKVDELPAGKRAVVFSGTVGQISSAFQTEIKHYNVAGVNHIANATDPTIPAALQGTVGGVVKLHDFRHASNISKTSAVSAAQLATPQFTYGSAHYLSPADYTTIYDIAPLYSANINGSGQTIAILARSNILLSDVNTFRTNFGLKANSPQIVITNSDPGIVDGDTTETTLDTEWSGAIAQSATVKVIVSASTNSADGIDLSALYAVNNNVAPIVSLSYGSCEAGMGSTELAFYNSLWQQAAAQGMSVMVSAGDSGAAGCSGGSASSGSGQAINGLCSSPYATCVGGTEFVEGSNPGQYWLAGNNSLQGSAISYLPETVWNESASNGGSGLWAGGGGASITYSKPTWQTGPGVPADGKRDVPDVSLTASGHDGYLITFDGGLYSVGGTSASAPSFAGLVALVNQKTNAKQGLVNTVLYPLAVKQAAGGAAVFHDVTMGNNTVPGVQGFAATTGYDKGSGLGSVDANVLVNNWAGAQTVAALTLNASTSTLTVPTGQSGQTTITSVASSTLKSAVTLTVSGAPTGVTATFTPTIIASPGSGTSVLKVTATSTAAAGNYTLTVIGTAGTQTAKVTVPVQIVVPTFTVATSASSATVSAGNSTQVTVTTAAQNSFSAAVALTATGMPTGMTAAFTPATIASPGSGTATLKVTAASTTAAGTYTLTVTGTGGSQTVKQTVAVQVVTPSFTVAASTTSTTVIMGYATQVVVTTAVQNGFSSAVALTMSGLPSGVTGAFSPASISNPASGSSNLILTVAKTAKAGSYPLTISATGGGLTKTTAVTLVVSIQPSCTLIVNPTSASLAAGLAGTVQIACGSVQGTFSDPLALSVTGLPSGVTGQFASSTMTPGSTGTLSLTSTTKAVAAKYALSVTASGNGFSQTVSLPLTITAASSFTLSGSASTVAITAGSTGQMTVTSAHVGVFNSAIGLSVSGLPAGVTASLSKTTLASPGDGSVTATFTVASSVAAGSYPVTVVGTGGGVSQSAAVVLTISGAKAGFTLVLNNSAMTVQQGVASSPLIVSIGNFSGGFNSTITLGFSGVPTGMSYANTAATTGNNLINISFALTASSATPAGTYPITVTGSGAGIVHTAMVQVTVTKAAATTHIIQTGGR